MIICMLSSKDCLSFVGIQNILRFSILALGTGHSYLYRNTISYKLKLFMQVTDNSYGYFHRIYYKF